MKRWLCWGGLVAILAASGCSGAAQAPVDASTELTPDGDAGALDAVAGDGGVDAATSDLAAPDGSAPETSLLTDADADAGPVLTDPPAGFDDSLYAPGRVITVDLTMAPADWATLRGQTRTLFDVLGPQCLDGVAKDPFTWFEADVAVDGYGGSVAGVRKKGFLGSMSADKPSLKVDLDAFVADQTLGDLERLTLNNSVQDPGYVRQCLAFAVFEAAGVPTPRCNYALVRVNGGAARLYVHVEPVKRDFLRRHFASDDGLLYEGALSDFRQGWLATFEQKTHEDAPSQAPLVAVVDALGATDAALLDALDAVIDLDAFMTFWAAEILVGHWDGYAGNTNNFYVYADPDDGGRLRFIPWGVDGAFPVGEQDAGPAVGRATGALAQRLLLHPGGRALLRARLSGLLETTWDSAALLDEVKRMDTLLRPHLAAGELQPFIAGREQVTGFIAARRARLEGELEAIDSLAVPPLRDAPCLRAAGTLTATVHTQWGTLGNTFPFQAGSGSGTLMVDGQGVPVIQAGAVAGLDPSVVDGSLGTLQVFLQPPGDRLWVVGVPMPTWAMLPGAVLPVDGATAVAYLFTIDAVTWDDAQLIGAIGDGTLTLDNGAPVAGADVDATLQGTIFALGF
jgi:hypothetical protein